MAYEPMTITFEFSGKKEQLSVNNENRLIKENVYTQSGRKNDFEEKISGKISNIEKEKGIQKLATAISKIYVDKNASYKTKMNAVLAYNSITESNLSIDDSKINDSLKTINDSKDDVYTYYEYMQFKRAYFNCESVKYSKNTGRIIEMNFKFNGTIE